MAWNKKKKNIFPLLHKVQKGLCFYCSRIMGKKNSTFDHFVPRSREGLTVITNLVLAHRTCNRDKADRMPTLIEIKRLERRNEELAKMLFGIDRFYGLWAILTGAPTTPPDRKQIWPTSQ